MKSALQLELENLQGLPFIAGIIWFALLGIFLLAIVILLIQKKMQPQPTKKQDTNKNNKSEPKGF